MSGGAARRRPVEHRPPTSATVKELYATALRCGRPGCMQLLYRVSETGARVLNSEVAHIHARRENGPRWNPVMTEDENRSYANLILLCRQDAKEIDDTPEHFPPDVLREWKWSQVATQEQAARSLPQLSDAEADEVIRQSFGLDELVAAITQVVPFSARSRSRDDALDLAVRQAFARRMVRLRPVPADRRDAVLIWMSEQDDPVVSVPEGQLRVLVAPTGAGKSEYASRWWDEGLAAAQADAEVEIPVWLDARRVTSGLEGAVTASIGRDPARSSRVVIDDLDGVSPREANRLLDEARQLVRTWQRVRVLATSRPGVPVSDEELIKVEPWPTTRGIDLVRVVVGDVGWRHHWTAEAASLLRSPLTAIAVAARLRAGGNVRVSRLALLRDLAQTIIERERPEQATPQLWDEYARLAGRILSAPAPVIAASFGNEAQVWQLTATGLVVNDDGTLRFALPVFEQHFGAQALRRGIVPLKAAADPQAFPRWRYAVAFAVSTGEPGDAEGYLLQMARTNPAVVAWVLDELAAGQDAVVASERPCPSPQPWFDLADSEEPGDPVILRGRWLREALQALIHGFGACGAGLSTHRDGRLVQWGVQFTEGWMAISEARETLPPPDLVRINDDFRQDRLSPGWIRRTTFQYPEGDFGRWFWARTWLSKPLAEMIHRRRLPVPSHSPLARERQWILARRIMQIAGKRHGGAIPRAELREAVDVLMEVVERSVHATWSGGSMPVDSHDVRWIHGQLQRDTGDLLNPPWPAPDLPRRPGPWQWQRYSPELTQAILTEVLRDAVTGYRDLVELNFAGFGWALGLNSVLPVHVEGAVAMHDDGNDPHGTLFYELKPDRTAAPDAPPRVHLDLITQPGYGHGARAFASIIDRRRTPFYVPTSHNTLLPTGQSRPATNLAYQWLAADLHAIGWLDKRYTFYD